MRRLAILAVTLTTMATVLMASRCSEDDETGRPTATQDAEVPVAAGDVAPALVAPSDEPGGGAEKDGVGEAADAPGAELVQPPSPEDGGNGEAAMDDPSFEPTPPTEGAADTATGP